MLNIMRLNVIYSFVYDLRKYKTIEEVENILFLLQYDHLNEKKYPLFHVKTHIGKNGIRVEYISDLLRISKRQSVDYKGYGLHLYRSIEKLYKKYKRISNEDIDKMVHNIISTQKLNKKYFVYNEYNNKYRKKARLTIRLNEYLFLPIVRNLLGLMSILSVFIMIASMYFTYVNKIVELSKEKYYFIVEIMLIGLISFIVWMYLTKKWMRPTEYELKHLND